MLENIRKYTGLFIIVLVLIFVGLVFLQSNQGGGGPSSGPTVVTTKDRAFSAKDLQKAAQEIQLSEAVRGTSMQTGSFVAFGDIIGFMSAMEANSNDEDALRRYLVHRDHLEQAKEEFGLYPSKDVIDLYQKENIFTNREGIFDDEGYKEFTEKGLKRLGSTVNELNDFIGNLISYKELENLLAAGLQTNAAAAQDVAIADNQEFTLSTLTLDLEAYRKEINPSEEDLKTYWEENKGRYLSEPKRKVTYFTAAPSYDEALAEKKKKAASAEKTATEKADDAEKTPEEIAAADKAKVEAITLTPQEKKRVADELGLSIADNIWFIIQQQVDEGQKKIKLEELAQEYGYEVKTTELLPLSELPTELKGSIRGSGSGGSYPTVEAALTDATSDSKNLMDSLSETLGIGTDNWLIFRVDETVDPAEKTFAEATEQTKTDYIEEKAAEALAEGIEAAREAVASALTAGKSLADAASAQNLKVTPHLGLKKNAPQANEPNTQDVYRLASQTKTGEVSAAEVVANNRGLFVHVTEREFVESNENKGLVNNAADRELDTLRRTLVSHWFTARFDAADVKIVRKK